MRFLIWFFAISFNVTMAANAETFKDWQFVANYNEVTQKVEAMLLHTLRKAKLNLESDPTWV